MADINDVETAALVAILSPCRTEQTDWRAKQLSQEACVSEDRADRLAGEAAITRGLRLSRSEVLWSLRHYLRAQRQGHHTIDRLEREPCREEALDDLP